MSLISFISKLFGNKSQRDLKELMPIVEKINALGPKVKEMSNDQLREAIAQVRQSLVNSTQADQSAIDELKAKIETLPFDQRQSLWDEIDKREKNILETLDKELDKNLPVVYAIVRETAARFAASETVEVTATQMDRDLAAQGRQPLACRWQRGEMGYGSL